MGYFVGAGFPRPFPCLNRNVWHKRGQTEFVRILMDKTQICKKSGMRPFCYSCDVAMSGVAHGVVPEAPCHITQPVK